MAWLNNKITPQIAIERGWNTWDVFLSNWNLELAVPIDLNSRLFPNPDYQAAIPSAFSVAIGPNSTVDRCWLQYNPNIDVDIGSVFPTTFNVNNEKLLAIRSPINFPVPGGIKVRADYHCDAVEEFIADDGAGTLVPFDWGAPSSPALAPLLHLVFYLQPPSLIPTHRYPFVEGAISKGAAKGEKNLVAVLPCYGRRTINLTVRCKAGDPVVNAGLLTLRSASTGYFYERIEWTTGPMTVDAIESVSLTNVANASFLTIWVDGTGPSDGGVIDYTVEAID